MSACRGIVAGLPVLLLAGLLVAGCTTQVPGEALPADGAADPIGVDGDILDVLPTEDELIELLGRYYEVDNADPIDGDLDDMPDGIRTESQYSPLECLGATSPGMRLTYEDFDVVAFAENNNYQAPTAVIAFGSRDEARDAFEMTVDQWQDCDGVFATLVVPGDPADLGYDISDVDESDDMLTAMFKFGSVPHGASSTWTSRALALRQNIIVDVEVHGETPADEPVPDNDAVEVVEFMIEKIADLSAYG